MRDENCIKDEKGICKFKSKSRPPQEHDKISKKAREYKNIVEAYFKDISRQNEGYLIQIQDELKEDGNDEFVLNELKKTKQDISTLRKFKPEWDDGREGPGTFFVRKAEENLFY